MSPSEIVRALVGRRIEQVELNPFDPMNGQDDTFNPVLVLDNGREIRFVVDETETGDYGVSLIVSPPTHRPSRAPRRAQKNGRGK